MLFLLRIVVVAHGDVDRDVLVFRSRSAQGGGFCFFRAALPAARGAAAQEHVAELRALASADGAQDDTKDEDDGADSAESGELDAAEVRAQQADLVLVFLLISKYQVRSLLFLIFQFRLKLLWIVIQLDTYGSNQISPKMWIQSAQNCGSNPLTILLINPPQSH